MASANGNIVPAAASESQFATRFSDTARDPFSGGYTPLFPDFIIDLATPANNTAPATIRNSVAAAGTQQILLAFGVFHEGKMHTYLAPTRMERSLGAPATAVDNKIFAFDGDLFSNQGMNVHLDDALFDEQANQIIIPTVTTVLDALVQDPAVVMMGPYTNNDAGTEVKKFRGIIPIPNCYVHVFLANEVTPNYFFTYVYPQMVIDGHEQDCAAFIDFFRAAMTRLVTGVDASSVQRALPVAPPRNTALLTSRRQVIMQHFPILNANLAQLQQSQIATQLGVLAQQQHDFKVESDARRAAKEVKSVETYLGPGRFRTLLKISRVSNEAGLAPIWGHFANSKKEEHLSILQSAINQELSYEHDNHLDFVASSSLLASVLKLTWYLTSKDAITTGLLNPFLYGDTDLVAAELENSRVQLMLSGGGTPSFADATQAIKNTLNLPSSNSSVRYIRRLKIMAGTVLGSRHVLTTWLRDHVRDMQSFSATFESWVPTVAPHLAPARGIFHCKWVATNLSVWVKEQGASPQAVDLPSSQFVSDAIQADRIWEPVLSPTFCNRWKIYDLCYASPPPPFLPTMPHGLGPVGGGGGGPAVGGGIPAIGGGIPHPPPLAIPRVPLQNQDQVCININFASHLFTSYKERPHKSATIRKKIKNGELPPLPPSKVDQHPMCLAFHTKGQCNLSCPRAADHVVYTDPEYVPICGWCTTNYPE